MKILFVGGTFGDVPKQSGFLRKLAGQSCFMEDDFRVINGGSCVELATIATSTIVEYDTIVWMPKVDNSKSKLALENIKKIMPHATLVISKQNTDGKYSVHALIARQLEVKANMLIEFSRVNGKIAVSLLDPLGNIYLEKCTDIPTMAEKLSARLVKLKTCKRVHSYKNDGVTPAIPNNIMFFDIAKALAERFHELVHLENKDRFLGNLSFRCGAGFPSFRSKNYILVSRRDIDRRYIDPEGFVWVNSSRVDGVVGYYGQYKPSVDTPVQVLLYQMMPEVDYMIHSHVYIEGAPMTTVNLPCGALQEVDEIKPFINADTTNFAINLKGHGSIVFAQSLDYFGTIKYIARPIPEVQEVV